MYARTKSIAALVALWLVAIHTPVASGQPRLLVKNDTDGYMELWVWKHSKSQWDQPLSLPRRAEKYIDLATPGSYWLVAQDDARRRFPMGWFDFHDPHRKEPKLEISLRAVYEKSIMPFWIYDRDTRELKSVNEEITHARGFFGWHLSDAVQGKSKVDIQGSIEFDPFNLHAVCLSTAAHTSRGLLLRRRMFTRSGCCR
jgi:hypothetical protein